jgi:hypothetical protein
MGEIFLLLCPSVLVSLYWSCVLVSWQLCLLTKRKDKTQYEDEEKAEKIVLFVLVLGLCIVVVLRLVPLCPCVLVH